MGHDLRLVLVVVSAPPSAAPGPGRRGRAAGRTRTSASLARPPLGDLAGSQSSRGPSGPVPPPSDAGAVTLRPWPWTAARALLAGSLAPTDTHDWHPDYPLDDTPGLLAVVLAAAEVDAPLARPPLWWLYQVVAGGEVVGDAGFLGPPAADGPVEVEIGYAVVAAARGRGVATQACRRLVELAWGQGADAVLADAEPDNPASRAVLGHCGFRQTSDRAFRLERTA